MSDDGTGSPKNTSKQEPQSPLTPGSPEQKQQLERELAAIFTSINQPQDILQEDLQDAAKKVASDIHTEVANILRRSARLSNKRAPEAAATEGLKLVNATDENINNMAKLLVPSTGMSSGDSVGSQFSQHLLGIAQTLGILPPVGDKMNASQYNAHIQEMLRRLGVEYEGLRMRDLYTATKGAKAIPEPQQFTDVWGESIAKHVKENGSCYLSGEPFLEGDYPEMDHVKFATSAFMKCIHYRELTKRYLCGRSVYSLWQKFIKTQPGINSLWYLYKALNLGKKKKKTASIRYYACY